MKTRSTLGVFLLLVTTWVLHIASSSGISSERAGAPGDFGTCAGCHTSVGSGSVSLLNAPTSYIPGESYFMQLRINDAVAEVGGFQIVATDGTSNTMIGSFDPEVDSGTKLATNGSGRLIHSAKKNFTGDQVQWSVQWDAPSSGSPENVVFYYAVNAANDNGDNGDGDFGYNSSTSTVLPVTYEYISGTQAFGKVRLAWKTSYEYNHSHFIVQVKEENRWTRVGKVIPSLDGEYTFYYDTPKSGENLFRLEQVDLDGSIQYSDVVSVHIDIPEYSLDFNMATNIVTINGASDLTFQLMDMGGNTVFTSNSASCDLSLIPSGIYVGILTQNGTVLATEKIVKI